MIASADGCKAGWLVAIADGWPCRKTLRLYICQSFEGMLEVTDSCNSVVVDIPIGLPEGKEIRPCDLEAREKLGKDGRSRVFLTPPRKTLEARTPEAFQAAHKKLRGVGAGLPIWGIVPKLREVDAVMTTAIQQRVREFHPELVWARLAGQTSASKHAAEGIEQRQRILWGFVPGLDSVLKWKDRLGRAAKLDDLFDAVIGLAAAEGIRNGGKSPRRLPSQTPPTDSRGLRMEIWF